MSSCKQSQLNVKLMFQVKKADYKNLCQSMESKSLAVPTEYPDYHDTRVVDG